MKDMILVVRMITLLGGIVVFTNPQLFSSNVSEFDLAFSKCFSFDNAYTFFSLGNLPFIRNYLYPSIPWNIKPCSLKSSRAQSNKSNCSQNSFDSLFPCFLIYPPLQEFVFGNEATNAAK